MLLHFLTEKYFQLHFYPYPFDLSDMEFLGLYKSILCWYGQGLAMKFRE